MTNVKEQLRSNRALRPWAAPASHSSGDEEPQPTEVAVFATASRAPLLLRSVIGLGFVLMSVGLIWGFQTWRQRSAVPIDDLLPTLQVSADLPTDPAVTATGKADPIAAVSDTATSEPVAGTSSVPDEEPNEVTPTPSIIVHVSGAVRHPGIVETSDEVRVYEVVELAGGALDSADLDRVNLASSVLDGQRIHIPHVGQEAPLILNQAAAGVGSAAPATADAVLVIDLNLASQDELESLPGIGPAIAQAIIRTRDERGPFLAVDELAEVPGIGATKLAVLRPFVRVG